MKEQYSLELGLKLGLKADFTHKMSFNFSKLEKDSQKEIGEIIQEKWLPSL